MQLFNLKRILVASALVTSAISQAAITFNFSTVLTGGTPVGSTPWATLVIANDGANQVKFTFTNNLSAASGQFISRLKLNVIPPASSYLPVSLLVNPGPDAATFTGATFGEDVVNGQGELFDYEVAFATSGSGGHRFTGGKTIHWDMTGTNLDESDFIAFSSPKGGNPLIDSLIHVQSIPGNGEGSSWDIGIVPEPTSLAALGIGFAALLRKRRK